MKIKPVVALAIALGVASPSVASGATRSDLRITSLIDPPSAMPVGAQFSTAATIKNAGQRRAPASRTGFYLSTNPRSRADDIRVANLPTRALRSGDATQRVVRIQLSETLAPGEYQLLVCADDSRRIPEITERNNCIGGANLLSVYPQPAP